MKMRFIKSEDDPNHYLKIVDDRPLILSPSRNNPFMIGAGPLTCISKRELDS